MWKQVFFVLSLRYQNGKKEGIRCVSYICETQQRGRERILFFLLWEHESLFQTREREREFDRESLVFPYLWVSDAFVWRKERECAEDDDEGTTRKDDDWYFRFCLRYRFLLFSVVTLATRVSSLVLSRRGRTDEGRKNTVLTAISFLIRSSFLVFSPWFDDSMRRWIEGMEEEVP